MLSLNKGGCAPVACTCKLALVDCFIDWFQLKTGLTNDIYTQNIFYERVAPLRCQLCTTVISNLPLLDIGTELLHKTGRIFGSRQILTDLF